MLKPLLQINALNIGFDTSRGLVRPVRDVSITIHAGQTVALVGESGCGKSVTSLSVLRLIPSPPGKVISGEVFFDGHDLLKLSEAAMRKVRGKDIAMIFQEPMTSLNPVYTIGDQITEAITLHQNVNFKDAQKIAEQALVDVGIADARRRLREYPHQMSGGMRQRVMIAMALSCQPQLLIADEPTTALDVTIQAQILELLRALQKQRNMAILLITHDLGVVAENADIVAVMYASRVVECATVEEIFDAPKHPYTQGLLNSVPKLSSKEGRLDSIPGAVPNPANFPNGCKFHPRCALARELAKKMSAADTTEVQTMDEKFMLPKTCTSIEPELREIHPSHWASCHFAENYSHSKMTLPVLNHRRQVIVESTAGAAQ